MTTEHVWDENLGNWQALNDAQRGRANPHQPDVASERICDIYIACARASCPKCAEGYTVIRSSAVGAFVHIADRQPKHLPQIYFDQVCQATHIWALAEAENESQAHAPQA